MADVLSDLLDLVRIERAEFMVLEVAAPGGFSTVVDGNIWLHLVLQGEAHFRRDGEAPIRLTRGDVLLLSKGNQFEIRDAPDSLISPAAELLGPCAQGDLPWIRFGGTGPQSLLVSARFRIDRERAKPLLRRLPDVVHLKSETGALPYWGGPLCDLTALRLLTSGPGAIAVMRRFGEASFIQVVRAYMGKADAATDRILSTLCRPQVSAALRLINSQPEKEWTISGLAKEVGMSRSAFAAAFAAEVGQSPMHYLTGVRMSMAAEILRSQTMTVSQVAFRVGFVSETSFARTFKRHFGVAPGAFRRPEPSTPPAPKFERGSYPGFVFFG